MTDIRTSNTTHIYIYIRISNTVPLRVLLRKGEGLLLCHVVNYLKLSSHILGGLPPGLSSLIIHTYVHKRLREVYL